jgi:hypothetical protein
MSSPKPPDNMFVERTQQRADRPSTNVGVATAVVSADQRRKTAADAASGEPPVTSEPPGAAFTAIDEAERSLSPAPSSNAADERAEIAKRIAAFRNLQIKLRQDREEYYQRTMARTRAVLASEAKPRQ